MVTYKTLEDYLQKCKTNMMDVQKKHKDQLEVIKEAEEQRDVLRNHLIAIQAQIETLQQLMDVEKNPPHIELPMAEDKIEEMFDERLEGPEGLSESDTRKARQDVYLKESLDAVEDIHAINTEEQSAGEDPQVNP